uniref:uncharacterized protein LOC120335936 n=1 Tax=Styela clava TaxID=7725 RepID=UPI001939D8B9|nr:uncharacterized protein LOC120335936 [Styela clava]
MPRLRSPTNKSQRVPIDAPSTSTNDSETTKKRKRINNNKKPKVNRHNNAKHKKISVENNVIKITLKLVFPEVEKKKWRKRGFEFVHSCGTTETFGGLGRFIQQKEKKDVYWQDEKGKKFDNDKSLKEAEINNGDTVYAVEIPEKVPPTPERSRSSDSIKSNISDI